ncbi:TetR/AcrR family transcriptional regulator [Holophaga foetida]|uniref:TetR/AcrR family transcriptional regulator n=1 Tax=Holophaga foetida TaxID=35839 RepID=UPI0002473377|nr:TetR/AcrR family transcriptional regulator [Holophaga foetida]
MIALQGYNATGLDSVLKEACVPKGSFYYYFKSKEDFGLAVIDHFAAHMEDHLANVLRDDVIGPLDRIRNLLKEGLRLITENQCAKGCLIGNLAQELAAQNERFRVRLDEVFRMWRGQIANCLREAQGVAQLPTSLDPDVTAGFILSGWEGAILRSKVGRSPQPMQDFIDVLFATVLR